MEVFAILVGLVLLVLFLAAPFIAIMVYVRQKRFTREANDRLKRLTDRIDELEKQVLKILKFAPRFREMDEELKALEDSAAKQAPAVIPPLPAAAEAPRAPAAGVEIPAAPLPAAPPVRPAPAPTAGAPAVGPRREPPPPPPMPAAPIEAPRFAPLEPPAKAEGLKSVLNLEETLGTDWLNKLGVVILVIGVALFLAYQLRTLGPAGKIFVGFSVSGALLGAGVFFERNERWRIIGRAGIGGGWALTFFTTYAMYHVPAARVLPSLEADLFLLFVVAAAMVGHTLKYRSQVVTGLAFLLAFSTVTISRESVSSLSAGAVLAAGLAVIVVRMQWYELEVLGILASYLNHYLWLRPIIERMGGHRHIFPEFYASAGLLVFYWAVFRASYILRKVEDEHAERVSTLAALLNVSFLLGLMKYQSVRPELAFYFLLALGAVELGLGQMPVTRRRRMAFVILTTIGATLLVAALPFKFSGATLPILWLAEAEAFVLAGVFAREIVFRRLGMLAGMLVALRLNQLALKLAFDTQWTGHPPGEILKGVMVFGCTVLVFYANAHWIYRRYETLITTELERATFRLFSYFGGLTALIALWWLLPEIWVAPAWAALALVMVFGASRTGSVDLRYQAHFVLAMAFARTLFANLYAGDIYPSTNFRLMTVGATAALLYAASRWAAIPRKERRQNLAAAYTWVPSALVATLAWYQLQPVSVALGWAILGLVLLELGFLRQSVSFRLQAYVALAASFFRLFLVNLNAESFPGELSPRVYTSLPLALAFFYAYWRVSGSKEEFLRHDRELKAPELLSYLGVATVAAVIRFEMPADAVIAIWSALILALAGMAWKTGRRVFLHQAVLLGFAVLFRTVLHNFYERSYFAAPSFWHGAWFNVGATVALLAATLPFAFRLKRPGAADSSLGRLRRTLAALGGHPEQVFFFLPFLALTGLLLAEMPKGFVTVAWGVEAVGVFLFALWVGQRSYRLTALGLLLLCVAKVVFRDVWGLSPRDRYLTFIVLGAALLGVSFLYTRYRETLRKYL